MSRALISLLEIYQQQDGSVLLPEALLPYVGKERLEAAAS
jgi:seryl-tRNA synthetase